MSKPPEERLRTLADKMSVQIKAKRNSAIGDQNYTARRAKIAASMARDADQLERIQFALYGLADAHENETIHPLLKKAMTKACIKSLLYHDEWPAHQYGEDARKRFAKVGLTPENYAEAKAAFMGLVNPPDRSQEHKRRELENTAQSMVGQIPGYFPTPPEVVSHMLDHADKWHHDLHVLEPSAGAGHIVDILQEEAGANWTIDVIELSPPLRELLEMKGYDVIASDFLQFEPDQGYDRILMNPPFEKAQDITHVRHAYDCLAPGGRLVSVMSEGTFFRNGPAAQFRHWLDEVGGRDVDLPADAFKSSGTGVKTRLVVIDKPGEVAPVYAEAEPEPEPRPVYAATEPEGVQVQLSLPMFEEVR